MEKILGNETQSVLRWPHNESKDNPKFFLAFSLDVLLVVSEYLEIDLEFRS